MDKIIIDGKFTSAIIFNEDAEAYAKAQVKMICDDEISEDSRIRVMPDVHPGMVGPIGLTMTIKDRLIPYLLGVDIGCGIICIRLNAKRIEFQKLDKVIRENVPSGFAVRDKASDQAEDFPLEALRCFKSINEEKARKSLGTLGGGNHFIEIDKDDEGGLYLIVHTGARHLGKEVNDYYVKAGAMYLKERGIERPYETTWIEGRLLTEYLQDVQLVQEYAALNRKLIAREIMKGLKLKEAESFDCTHNFIRKGILRKGSISAAAGERVIIPINMKDGVVIGIGKGNEDWNCSAPHGSGRVLARNEVKGRYTVASFKKEMQGIYCSCMDAGTLDEAPFAYRRIDSFIDKITPTVEVDKILKPVFNFKAGNR